jgi:hypothetical protein
VQLTLSVLESLTRLPVSEREAILASESEAAQLQYDWSFYARPNQLLPGERLDLTHDKASRTGR